MKVIMKNNFRRLLEQKQIIVLLVLFTAAASCAAVFVSTGMTQKWDVAVVSPASAELASKQVNIIPMEEAPPHSELVMGRYDAVLTKECGRKLFTGNRQKRGNHGKAEGCAGRAGGFSCHVQ